MAGTALAAYGAYRINKFIKNKNVAIARERGKIRAAMYIKDNLLTPHISFNGATGYVRRNGKLEREVNLVSHLSRKSGVTGKYHTYIDTQRKWNKLVADTYKDNKQIKKDASKIVRDAVKSAEKENFRTAARNVLDDYQRRKKK